jgi:hypothetical protein
MKKRSMIAAGTAALTVVVGSLLGASSAQAFGSCTIEGFTPRTVVIGLTPKVVNVRPLVSGCTPTGWAIDGDGFYTYDGAPEEVFSVPAWNSDAGPQNVVVEADDENFDTAHRVFADGFSLKRRTTWQSGSFNASPEPVRAGSTISIKGRLLVADWTADAYRGYAHRTVQVQFRTPTGSYATVKTVHTGSTGWVRTTVTAKRTGVWRIRYGGNSVAGSALSVGDAVGVTG